jgi:hypothetical protein
MLLFLFYISGRKRAFLAENGTKEFQANSYALQKAFLFAENVP